MNRKRSARLTVLLTTDGSRQAHAALAFAAAFPWADTATAHMVLARGGIPLGPWPADIWVAGMSDAPDRALEREISRARRIVRHRWPDMTVSAMNTPPIEAIIAEARRRRAGVIVVGSRGLGFARRLMLGSVSRGVVRRAGCPVLVVKGRRRRIKTGGPRDRRLPQREPGAGLPARPARATGRRASQGGAGPGAGAPSHAGPVACSGSPSGTCVGREPQCERTRQARREVAGAAVLLKRAGWRARGVVREGVPLAEVLREAAASRADLLVVGARGTGGLARLLLGSVAEGVLDHSPVPVLLVK